MDRFQAIRIFLRVVELGSFSKAAAELDVAQSSVTKYVARLEQHLGARLLHRSSHEVSLTEIGSVYYEKCRLVAHHLEEAESVAALMNSRLEGTVRISTSVAFGARVLGPLVMEFMRLHPTLRIDLELDDQYVNLLERGIDLAVRMGPLPDSTFGARHLGTNPWVLVASKDYLERAGTPGEPGDLGPLNALVYSTAQGNGVWQLSHGDGRSVAAQVRGTFRSNSLQTLLEAAVAGMGVCALPSYVAQAALAAGQLSPVLVDWKLPGQQVHAVFPSPRMVPSKVSSLIDWLKGRFAGDWWAPGPR